MCLFGAIFLLPCGNVKKAHKELTAVSAVLLGLAIQLSKSELLQPSKPRRRAPCTWLRFRCQGPYEPFKRLRPHPNNSLTAPQSSPLHRRQPHPKMRWGAAYTDLDAPCQLPVEFGVSPCAYRRLSNVLISAPRPSGSADPGPGCIRRVRVRCSAAAGRSGRRARDGIAPPPRSI